LKDLKDLFGKNFSNIESICLDKTYENTFKDIKQRIGKNTLIFLVILQSFLFSNIIKLYIDKSKIGDYLVFV
jgi:hypothetical protein